jgi:hypothetical protein
MTAVDSASATDTNRKEVANDAKASTPGRFLPSGASHIKEIGDIHPFGSRALLSIFTLQPSTVNRL